MQKLKFQLYTGTLRNADRSFHGRQVGVNLALVDLESGLLHPAHCTGLRLQGGQNCPPNNPGNGIGINWELGICLRLLHLPNKSHAL